MRADRLGAATLLATAVTLAACATGRSPVVDSPAAGGTGPRTEAARLDVRSLGHRPPLLLLARDGDPRATLAAAVMTGGGAPAAAALSGLVQARLAAAGVADVDATWDGLGYRLRILLADASEVERAMTALLGALTTPVGDDVSGKKLAAARVNALRARAVDDPAMLPLAACSGEPSVLGSETLPDLAGGPGAAQLEAWRSAAHGVGGIALALVGPAAFSSAAETALGKIPELPAASLTPDPPPPSAEATYVEPSRRRGTARLSFALRVGDRSAAMGFAERAGDPRSPLVARLSSLPLPFHVRRVSATLRRGGACVLVEAESDPDDSTASRLESTAALAASVIRQEVGIELATRRDDPSVAARQIRGLGDSREAASAAAWWALSQQGASGPPTTYAALALAPPALLPRGSGAADSSAYTSLATRRFVDALRKGEAAWSLPVAEAKTRLEKGQGEVWVLLGKLCPVAEAEADAGLAALGALAAARAASGIEGVVIEPWVAPDGAGLLAHATPAARGETADELAIRVADALARAFSTPPAAMEIDAARAALLARLDRGGERARDPIAQALAPGQPARLAPWGLFDAVARESAEAVRLRWATLAAGPVRVAVLAGETASQADEAVRAIDRWMVRTTAPRRCASLPPSSPPLAGNRSVPVGPHRPARAFVAVPVDASGPLAAAAELTVLALAEDDGLVARALADTGARAETYLLGTGTASALVVELRGPEASLDAASAQVKALFGRLSRGAVGDADQTRAAARWKTLDTSAHLEPARRVLDLWRGATSSAPPLLPAWRAWLSSELRDDRVAVLVSRPP